MNFEKKAFYNSVGRFIVEKPLTAAANLLFGRPNKAGPMIGRRLNLVGQKTIDAKKYEALKAEALAGKQVPAVGTTSLGGYVSENYRPGGAVGLAMKHPLITAGAGYMGYNALSNRRRNRQQEQMQQQYQQPQYTL